MNEESAITLFCLIDDVFKAYRHKRLRDPNQEVMSDSEVAFAGILAARLFAGNLRKGIAYMAERNFCLAILSESQFSRRLHGIPQEIWSILQTFLARAAGAYENREYIIDSFPCPVCHNIRISRCRIARGEEYRGYNANKKQFFYGLKVHAITSVTGIPISFEWSPGSSHDLSAFKTMNMGAIEEGVLYGDAAYNDYALEEQLREAGLKLLVDRKQNSKRPHSPEITKQIAKKRKMVETCFSGIMRLFPRTIQAVRLRGLVLKLTLFVGAFTSLAIF
jgi:Transposase DDE domain